MADIETSNSRPQMPHSVRASRRESPHFLTATLLGGVFWLVGGVWSTGALRSQVEPASPAAAAQCDVAPRSDESLAALLQAPPGSVRSASPVVTAAPSIPTGGIPADAMIVEGVTATARELVACFNAGDTRRVFALYTDAYLVRFLQGLNGAAKSQTQIEAALSQLGSPTPVPADRVLSLVSVDDVRVLPDGRVTAITQVDHGKSLSVFAKIGGRYLLDGSYPLPSNSTPTP